MAITPALIGSIAAVGSAGVGIAELAGAGGGGGGGGGGSTPQSGGTPQTATGGYSANILNGQQMGQAGSQYLQDAMGLQQYGQGYAQQFFPQVAGATQAAAYNPYGGQAIGGAQAAGAYGLGALAPYQAGGAAQLGGLASQYSPYAIQALSQAFQPTAGSAYQNQYLQQAATPAAGQVYSDMALQRAFGALPGISDASQQALATGFAPNNGLYNQQLQRTTDQSNAINAMYGLSQSPYGASLTDQNVQNFNNSFNMNQAQLQSQAAGTYSNLMNENLAYQNQGMGAFGQLQNANLAKQTGNLNAYNSLADTQLNTTLGLGGLGASLGGAAGSLYGQGSALGQGAYSTLGTAGGLPAQAYQGLANNSLAAYGTGAQNANATLNPYTTYLNSLGSILGLGQIGQQNAAQQAQAGFGQQQQVGQNVGNSLAQLGGAGGQMQTLWDAINGPSSSSFQMQNNPYQQPNGLSLIQPYVPPPSFDLSQLPNLSAMNFG